MKGVRRITFVRYGCGFLPSQQRDDRPGLVLEENTTRVCFVLATGQKKKKKNPLFHKTVNPRGDGHLCMDSWIIATIHSCEKDDLLKHVVEQNVWEEKNLLENVDACLGRRDGLVSVKPKSTCRDPVLKQGAIIRFTSGVHLAKKWLILSPPFLRGVITLVLFETGTNPVDFKYSMSPACAFEDGEWKIGGQTWKLVRKQLKPHEWIAVTGFAK